MPADFLWVMEYAAYLIFAMTAILGWRFNRSRVFYIVFILAISQLAICTGLDAGSGKGTVNKFDVQTVILIISVLIPLNILVFSLPKERGIFTVWGLAKAGFIALQIAFAIYLLNTGNQKIMSFLKSDLFPLKNRLFDSISQLSVITFVIVFIILLVRYIRYSSNLDLAFSGVLLCVFTALLLRNKNMAVQIFFTASGLILLVSTIHDSYSMAFMDELTGLPSRRALRHELLKLSGRYTIAMLDIDFFKKFNDTYGHDVGDQVLRMVASCIRDVSGGGKAFRYGGEEFTILFPGKSVNDSISHLESLRETVSKRGFYQRAKNRPKKKPKKIKSRSKPGKQLFVTISIGVAEKNDKHRHPDEVIKAADAALYRAKKKGRNCVSK